MSEVLKRKIHSPEFKAKVGLDALRGTNTINEMGQEYGAKNQLTGTVKEIKRGIVMSQVNLKIPAGLSMSSVLTLESLDDLGINEGNQVKVVVKAVNVLLIK